MVNEHNTASNKSDQIIAPAKVSLNAAAAQQSSSPSNTNNKLWVYLGGATTLLIALAVIFVLPALVERSADQTISANPPTIKEEKISARTPTESPWTDAQFAKERRETQNLLAKMLERQEALQEKGVTTWAEQEYNAAVLEAEQADLDYRAKEFTKARQAYTNVLETFDALLERTDIELQKQLDTGETALQEGETDKAIAAFTIASAIQPANSIALSGLERAQVNKEAYSLYRQAKIAFRNNDLANAASLTNDALALDNKIAVIQSLQKEIQQGKEDNNFAAAMSQGFAALNANDFATARNNFRKALAINPAAADAKAALQQAEDNLTQSSISDLLARASKEEEDEKWEAAVATYDRVLEIDETVVSAKVGKIRANSYLTFTNKFSSVIDNPQRLATGAVYQDYAKLITQAKELPNIGPELQSQISQVEQAMITAKQPVSVTLRSDQLTLVKLLRVGDLGQFSETSVTLLPGTYTAVGTREGYRDVREEFTVSAENSAQTIVVQCQEKIANG